MSTQSANTNGGSLILGMLGVLFVGLKLTGVIDWSWWYVTLPFWGGLALVVVVFVFAFAFLSIREAVKK